MSEITRLFDFAYHQQKHYNIPNSLVTKKNGKWEKTSSDQYIEMSNTISRALLRLGVQVNDKIAIISSSNRTEWHIMDVGILQLGAQNVPVYPTISEDEYQFILNHSGASYCFVSDEEIFRKVSSVRSQLPELKEVFSFEDVSGCKNWKELLESGKDNSNQPEVQSRMDAIKTDDLATIIYTSGTTGQPKGVMLSHKNIVSNVLGSEKRIPFEAGKSTAMSFLPICHIYERMVVYLYQYYGVGIHFAESIDKISENINEVHPNVMTVVPRLLEKVYEKIYAKGGELTGIKKMLFFWAIDLAENYKPYGENGGWYEFKLGIARKLIFSKWKAALGGRLELMVSGSAALQPRLSRIFAAAGLPVMEGYGLTETSPVIAVNDMRNHNFKVGTVGKPIDNVIVKIAEDGEILVSGPSIMLGYYKNPEKTQEVMTGDFFHTGDIGEIDSEGFLKITDRKKEIFKTSGGKYIAPQPMENAFKQSRFIEQVMVIGEGEKMPAAFIQPNFAYVKEWARIHKISINDKDADIVNNDAVKERIWEEVEKINVKFGHWEQIKKIELTPEVWSIDGGELTPTLKLKRKKILEKYKDLYNKIYPNNGK